MFEAATASDAELVTQLRVTERVIAAANAEQIEVIAELHARAPKWLTAVDPGCPRVHPVEVTAAEVGPALRISRMSATDRVDLALTVTSRLPATLALLGAGTISMTKVRQIAEATATLTDEDAAAVEARVLPRAGDQTPGGFGVSLARAVIACDPAAAEDRRQQAVRERRVDVFPGRDGMATFRALLPAAQALAAHRSVSEAAGLAAVPGDTRTADARRADTLAEVLMHLDATPSQQLTAMDQQQAARPHDSADSRPNPSAPRDPAHPRPDRSARPRWRSGQVSVHVTVPLTSLIGCDQQPGHLTGSGPITAETARELAAEGTWRRLVTDPLSGAVLDVGRTTYCPPRGLADHVRSRDGTCRFPGCRQPAVRGDLDHTEPFPDGRTASDNLAALCRGHHRLKTLTRWQVSQNDDGVLSWTSPTGESYVTHPWQAHPPSERTQPAVQTDGHDRKESWPEQESPNPEWFDQDRLDQDRLDQDRLDVEQPELTDAEYDAQFRGQLALDALGDADATGQQAA